MRLIKVIGLLLSILVMTACKTENKSKNKLEGDNEKASSEIEIVNTKKVTFSLVSKSGSMSKGIAYFEEKDGMVTFKASLTGLEKGTHAIHIHEKADCSSVDGKSAGEHWNPTHMPHGKWGDSKGYHKGDIGNFEADKNGKGTVTMVTDTWCVGCNNASKNVIGKAIIVHQGKDDYVSQPSGAAGKRISCGGIIR